MKHDFSYIVWVLPNLQRKPQVRQVRRVESRLHARAHSDSRPQRPIVPTTHGRTTGCSRRLHTSRPSPPKLSRDRSGRFPANACARMRDRCIPKRPRACSQSGQTTERSKRRLPTSKLYKGWIWSCDCMTRVTLQNFNVHTSQFHMSLHHVPNRTKSPHHFINMTWQPVPVATSPSSSHHWEYIQLSSSSFLMLLANFGSAHIQKYCYPGYPSFVNDDHDSTK